MLNKTDHLESNYDNNSNDEMAVKYFIVRLFLRGTKVVKFWLLDLSIKRFIRVTQVQKNYKIILEINVPSTHALNIESECAEEKSFQK